jgi:hypothetical protein
LNVSSLTSPSICMVTVDSLGNNNEIYWEKTLYPEADTFFVLRETSGAVYSILAKIPKNAFSSYVDTNRSTGLFNGNPNLTSYKYKLQYRDSCGNLSALSPYHQSIFVQDNQTGNFTWNYYVIEGIGNIQWVSYILWRQNVLTGITTTVGGTSNTAFTDPLYAGLALTGNVKWYVSTSGFNCNPTQRTSAAVKTRTKSNNTNERQFPTGLEYQYQLLNSLLVYPNPADYTLILESSSELKLTRVVLTDLAGRVVQNFNFAGNGAKLDVHDLSNGIYLMTISPEGKSGISRKVIIQH